MNTCYKGGGGFSLQTPKVRSNILLSSNSHRNILLSLGPYRKISVYGLVSVWLYKKIISMRAWRQDTGASWEFFFEVMR